MTFETIGPSDLGPPVIGPRSITESGYLVSVTNCLCRSRRRQPVGHADEGGQRPCLHLRHDLPSMGFDGLFRRAKDRRDLLVEPARHHQGHYLTLARRERVVPLPKYLHFRELTAKLTIAFERGVNRVEQELVIEWLGEHVERPRFHRANGQRDVDMSRYEDDGQFIPIRAQLRLQIQS